MAGRAWKSTAIHIMVARKPERETESETEKRWKGVHDKT
jgi:hypothetical protein